MVGGGIAGAGGVAGVGAGGVARVGWSEAEPAEEPVVGGGDPPQPGLPRRDAGGDQQPGGDLKSVV